MRSIIHGSTQEIALTSEPSAAEVIIDGQHRGKTPLSVTLRRKERHTVTISLPGYETQEIALERRVNGWVWGNILLGGLIGLVIDASTGAMYKIDPATLRAQLTPEQVQARNEGLRLHVLVRRHISPGWDKVGQLQRSDAGYLAAGFSSLE